MRRKRKTNKNIVIIALIVLLLLLSVGYAAFSDTLTITGTANAKGTFDLEFQNADVVTSVGVNAENTKAIISGDKNTLTVTVDGLAYPGAGVEFATDIVNVGSIPATVEVVTPFNMEGSDALKNAIKIKGLDAITTEHPTLASGDRCNIHFTVEWDKDATAEIGEADGNLTFGLTIQYTQKIDEVFSGKTSHSDGTSSSNTTGGSGNTNTVISPVTKDDPTYTLPTGLTATYGQTLANVTLPTGFTWNDETQSVGNVGEHTFKATYTPEDTEHYNVLNNIDVQVTVEKANPSSTDYTLPEGLKAEVGDTLESITLPEGFRFKDGQESVLDTAGLNKIKIIYTPQDTENYNEIELEVTIGVEKKNPTYTLPEGLTATAGQKLSDIALPTGFTWNAPNTVLTEGTYTFKVTFTPEDTDKYNTLTNLDVTVNVTAATLAQKITPADYGKTINYSVRVSGSLTLSDWKVFSSDGTNVKIITADYIPQTAIPNVAITAGLSKVSETDNKRYCVIAESDEKLISILSNSEYWVGIASGIEGATAKGGPTNEEFVESWNTNPNISKEITLETSKLMLRELDPTELYIPHKEAYYGCSGYWLSSFYSSGYNSDELIPAGCMLDYDESVRYVPHSTITYFGLRPVVTLPSNVYGTIGNTSVTIETE